MIRKLLKLFKRTNRPRTLDIPVEGCRIRIQEGLQDAQHRRMTQVRIYAENEAANGPRWKRVMRQQKNGEALVVDIVRLKTAGRRRKPKPAAVSAEEGS